MWKRAKVPKSLKIKQIPLMYIQRPQIKLSGNYECEIIVVMSWKFRLKCSL